MSDESASAPAPESASGQKESAALGVNAMIPRGLEMPRSNDAEEGVLSCFLQNPGELLSDAMTSLPTDAFYHVANRLIFEQMLAFHQQSHTPLDFITFSQHLIDRGVMDKAGGPAQMAHLLNFVPTAAHYGYYKGILRDKLWMRRVISETARVMHSCFSVDGNPHDVLAQAQTALFNLSMESSGAKQWHEVATVAAECAERMEQTMRHKGHIAPDAIATGFTELDRRTMGLKPGELFVIGARPAMGKTALAMNLATCCALANGHYDEFQQEPIHVLVITTEMSRHELVDRQLVALSKMNTGKLRTGMLSREDARNYSQAVMKMAAGLMSFIDTGSLSIQELLALLRSKVQDIRSKRGPKFKILVVVDYIQRLRSDSKRAAGNRNLEIAEITSGLKSAAKDFQLVVIALAQVGRSAERGTSPEACRPSLGDLRESGDIEADADMVGLLFRPGYYARRRAAEDNEDADSIEDNKAELIMAKYRRGSNEPIPLIWDGPHTEFRSMTHKLFSNNDEERERH